MTRRSLTDKPAVPVLVRAAAIGALAWTPLACGSDDGGSNSSDQFPTDPCLHATSPPPECNSGTGMETSDEETTDVAPTTPCAHDPLSCESTGIDMTTGDTGTSTGGDTDTDTDTDTDAGTGSSSGGGSTSTGAG